MLGKRSSLMSKIITYSHVINAFATVILVFVTIVYVYFTYRMEMYSAADRKPYFSFDGLNSVVSEVGDNSNDYFFEFKFSNPGKAIIKYAVNSIKFSDNIPIKSVAPSAKKAYIFPGKEVKHFYCVIDGKKIESYPLEGTLEYDINYWSTEQENKLYKSIRKMKIFILKDGVRWIETYENETQQN